MLIFGGVPVSQMTLLFIGKELLVFGKTKDFDGLTAVLSLQFVAVLSASKVINNDTSVFLEAVPWATVFE